MLDTSDIEKPKIEMRRGLARQLRTKIGPILSCKYHIILKENTTSLELCFILRQV